MEAIAPLLIILSIIIPLLILTYIYQLVRTIKDNSNSQVIQNDKIIELLEEIKNQKKD
jgi:hypothetical protein